MNNFQEKVNLIWAIADLLRGDYKPHEYADVILPFTVFRRLDQAIEPTRQAVRAAYDKYQGRLDNLDSVLRSAAAALPIYNTSDFNWQRLLDAPDDIAHNLVNYLNGYSPQVQDIVEKFDFRRQIGRLQGSKLIFPIMREFVKVDLHPDRVSNTEMGYVFEELIRKFAEQFNETAGEHFTPREVIRLMVRLLFSEDEAVLHQPNLIRTIYDPACGTGGMLTVSKDFILEKNKRAQVILFGQELNPTAFAVAKSDMLLKGEDPERIVYGNSFSEDGYPTDKFNFMLSNPPFGVSWKKVEWVIKQEYERKGGRGRFGAGLPRINDGSLLFLQHMLSKMKDDAEGSRIAIIFNGSPLFTGDAGSGESEIRRWILENDWLEGIVALPDQLFYNTGINTYIWILTNRKSARRKGRVQLIDATRFYEKKKPKSLGDKRNEISNAQIDMIARLYADCNASAFEVPVELLYAEAPAKNGGRREPAGPKTSAEFSLVFDTIAFGYRKVRIDRPLRLNFQASSERIARLEDEVGFRNLAQSRKQDEKEKQAEEAAGRSEQEAVRKMLTDLPAHLFKDRREFEKALRMSARQHGLTLKAPVYTAILSVLSEKDETAEICFDKAGRPEPDNDLRDYENVPLVAADEPAAYTSGDSWLDEKVPLTESVWDYFLREVRPYVTDAFIDASFVDEKDGQVGRVGYEINFNRYFYKYQPPRPLVEIEADIRQLEQEILEMLREVAA